MLRYIRSVFLVMLKYARAATLLKLAEVVITAAMTPISLLLMQNLIDGFISYFNGGENIYTVVVWALLLLLSMFLASSTNFINGIQSRNMKRQNPIIEI